MLAKRLEIALRYHWTLLLNMQTKVVLACTVEDKEGLLQWTKDDFGLGTKRDLPGYPR